MLQLCPPVESVAAHMVREYGVNYAYPPLNAPTGFLAGKGAASANRCDDVWKLRTTRKVAGGEEVVRNACDRKREAMFFWK